MLDLESIDQVLRDYRTRFRNGRFSVGPGDDLRATVARANVPKAHGVYLIYASSPARSDRLQYIGRSGTMHRDGTLSRQTLRSRLTNRQQGMDRERFFRHFMERHAIGSLEFEWFVTFDGTVRILPALAEAVLLQAHFDRHRALPAMNRMA